ncbi:MAG: hypothetical protein ACOZQL_32990 [Myxococcota bacterium]
MRVTSLRGLLPIHSTPTLAVTTVDAEAPLAEVAARMKSERLDLLLVVTDGLSLEGAVRADLVERVAARAPELPVRSLPLGRVARVDQDADGGTISALLENGEYLAVMMGAGEGSVVITPEGLA